MSRIQENPRTWHLWNKELQFFNVLSSPIRTDHLFTRFCLVKAVERLLNELFVPGVGLEAGKKKEKKNKQCSFGGWGSFHSKGIDD